MQAWVPWSLFLGSTVAYVHIMCNDKPHTEAEAKDIYSDHLQTQAQKWFQRQRRGLTMVAHDWLPYTVASAILDIVGLCCSLIR